MYPDIPDQQPTSRAVSMAFAKLNRIFLLIVCQKLCQPYKCLHYCFSFLSSKSKRRRKKKKKKIMPIIHIFFAWQRVQLVGITQMMFIETCPSRTQEQVWQSPVQISRSPILRTYNAHGEFWPQQVTKWNFSSWNLNWKTVTLTRVAMTTWVWGECNALTFWLEVTRNAR